MQVLKIVLLILLFFGPWKNLNAKPIINDSTQNSFTYAAKKNGNVPIYTTETAHIRKQIHNNPVYYTYILLGALIIIASIRIIAPTYIRELFSSVFSPAQLNALYQEGKFGFNFTNILFDIIFIAEFSILIQMAFFPAKPDIFYLIAAFTAGAYYLKLLLIQVFAYIFFDKSETLWHSLYHLLFTRTSGVMLLPCLFFTLFQTYVPEHICILIILVLLITFYSIWLIRLFVKMKIGGTSDFFYHFLYLCALEISPILILVKNFVS